MEAGLTALKGINHSSWQASLYRDRIILTIRITYHAG